MQGGVPSYFSQWLRPVRGKCPQTKGRTSPSTQRHRVHDPRHTIFAITLAGTENNWTEEGWGPSITSHLIERLHHVCYHCGSAVDFLFGGFIRLTFEIKVKRKRVIKWKRNLL